MNVLRHVRSLVGDADLPDGVLLERFIGQHDHDAFAQLVCRHGPMVRGVCRRLLQDPRDVDDAFQATFILLARKASSISHCPSVGSWLYRVTFRVALRARKSAARLRAREIPSSASLANREEDDMAKSIEAAQRDPSDQADWSESLRVLDEELNRLPENHLAPLVMCYLEGRTNEEAASLLGWPAGSMSWHLSKARESLRDRLAKRGVALSSVAVTSVLAGQAGASVSTSLVSTTLEAVTRFGVEQAATPGALLAQESLYEMGFERVRQIAAGVLALVALCTVMGWYLGRPASTQPVASLVAAELPPGAVARLGNMKYRHPGRIVFASYTPDGKWLISAGTERTMCVWEVPSGKLHTSLQLPPALPLYDLNQLQSFALAMSPSGRQLALVDTRGTIALWDWERDTVLDYLRDPGLYFQVAANVPAWGIAYSPDGSNLAVREGAEVTVYNLESRQKHTLPKVPIDLGVLRFIAYSRDGASLLLTTAAGEVSVVDGRTGATQKTFHLDVDPGQEWMTHVCLNSTGSLLAVGTTLGRVALFKTDSGIKILDRTFAPTAIGTLAFSNDNRLAIRAETITFWNIAREQALVIDVPTIASQDSDQAMAFAPGGEFLAIGTSGVLRFWNSIAAEMLPTEGHVGTVEGIWPGNNEVLSWGGDRNLRRWDSGKEIGNWNPRPGHHRLAHASEARLWLSGGDDSTLVVWSDVDFRAIRTIDLPETGIADLAVTSDGTMAAFVARTDGTLYLWNLADNQALLVDRPVRKEPIPEIWNERPRLAFSASGKYLIACGKERWRMVDVERRQFVDSPNSARMATVFKHFSFEFASSNRFTSAIPTPNEGGSLLGDHNGTLYLVDSATSVPQKFACSRGAITALAISSDGTLAACGTETNEIILWDLRHNKPIAQASGHFGKVSALAFSPDGSILYSGSTDTTILAWDVATVVKAENYKAPEWTGFTGKLQLKTP